MVRLLLENGAGVDVHAKNGLTALCGATQNGHLDVAKLLLAYGADANLACGDGFTPLHAATYPLENSSDLVGILLDAGAEIVEANSTDFTNVLDWAAKFGTANGMRALLEAGMDPNASEGNALQNALAHSNMGCVDVLISAGAEPLSRGGTYGSPLSAAACGGIEPLKLFLARYSVEPTFRDIEGRTVLHVAASMNNLPMLTYLLDLGLEATQEDSKGWSAIHYAVLGDTTDCLEALLTTMTSVRRSQTADIWSPLHLACRRNSPEALSMLIKAGFNPTTVQTSTPHRDWNLYDIARAYRNSSLIDESGNPKHDILHKLKAQSDSMDIGPQFPPYSDWLCDGCVVGYVSLRYRICTQCTNTLKKRHTKRISFELRFHCTVCEDFDYCFMCVKSAAKTHAHPYSFSPMFDIKSVEGTIPKESSVQRGDILKRNNSAILEYGTSE